MVWSGGPRGTRGRRRVAILPPREGEPSGRNQDHEIGEPLAVHSLRSIRLGGEMPEFVVDAWHGADLGELMERIDEQLDSEQHEEERRDLEESLEVHPLPIARPRPTKQCGKQN